MRKLLILSAVAMLAVWLRVAMPRTEAEIA